MNLIHQGFGKALAMCLLLLTVASCGGGGGGSDGSDGGFVGPSTQLSIEMSVGQSLLPLNFNNEGPARGGPFTTPVTVVATIAGRPVDNETIVQYTITSGYGSGALFCLLNDSKCIDTDSNQIAFEAFDALTAGGVTTMFFHALDEPGTVTITATVTDPVSGRNVSDSVQITVAQGSSTQRPAIVQFIESDTPLYITGQGQVDQQVLEIRVRDDSFQEIPNSAGNNLKVELLANRPNGGERLSAVDAQGNLQEGTVVNTRTLNGVAQVTLRAGTLPGSVRISATADRADNNVDNGINNAVADTITKTIGSGEVRTLTFTGSYPAAVDARTNILPLGPNDLFDGTQNGVYSRLITVIAADQFGNPPPPGTEITFFLGDDPLTGYPQQGHGEFILQGQDGDIDEGGFGFTTPSTGSSFAGATTGCLLFYGDIRSDGEVDGRPDREGARIITGVAPGGHSLTVNNPFNTAPDRGFNTAYTITCPPTRGNIEITPILAGTVQIQVQTDSSGVASTLLNYPVTQLGRRFCLAAQANGGLVGTVMGSALCNSWYLGIADGSYLTLNGEQEDLSFTAPVGGTNSAIVTIQLFDGNDQPLPAEPLDIQVVVEDPDATDAIIARDNAELAFAQADDSCQLATDYATAYFEIENPGEAGTIKGRVQCVFADLAPAEVPLVYEDENGNEIGAGSLVVDDPCDVSGTVPVTLSNGDIVDATFSPSPACAVLDALEATASADLQNALALDATANEAERRDALYNPTATFVPSPVATGAQGLVDVTFTVSDLPPNGQAQFFITTVGPEYIAPTRTVTFQPETGDGSGSPQN